MAFFRTVKVLLICFLLISSISHGQNNIATELLKETQKYKLIPKDRETILLWWMPTEYWKLALGNDPSVTKTFVTQFVDIIKDYLIFALHDGTMSPMGVITSKSKEEMIPGIFISLEDNTRLFPLSDSELTKDVKNYIMFMKPLYSDMLGDIGKGLEFIVFNNKKSDQSNYIDPKFSNNFNLYYNGISFSWRLPLGSLLPEKIDPQTKEIFPGNYNFNPYTGNKLIISNSIKN